MDAEGLEAVTMRRLGRELGVEAMSLYHHVEDKEALLSAMSEAVVSEIDVPIDPAEDPLEQLRALASGFRRVLLRHPESLPLFSIHRGPFRTATALRPVEATLGLLDETGLSEEDVVHAYCLFVGYTLGFVTNEVTGFLSREATDHKAHGYEELFAAFPAEEFPAVARFLPSMLDRDADANFAFGLDVILRGIRERTHRTAGRPRR
jgi:AcrR family transcriptional regulator